MLRLRFKVKVHKASNGQPLPLEQQLEAQEAAKGKPLTRGEIKKLKYKCRKAEQEWRKSRSKYEEPRIGKATRLRTKHKRRKSCTAMADATTYSEESGGSTSQHTPPPIPDGYTTATDEELHAMNPTLFPKRGK